MQKLKGDIQACILNAARSRFAHRGYLKTSMRDISGAAGVGLSNVYNYFTSKDELFRAVVKPVLEQFEAMIQKHHGRYGRDAMYMTGGDYRTETIDEYTSLIGRYRPLIDLLLFKAQGSSLENYREQFTGRATELVRQWFDENKLRHPEMNTRVSTFSIRMHTVWMFTLFEEIIMHDVQPHDIRQIVEEYVGFEIQGWRYILKI